MMTILKILFILLPTLSFGQLCFETDNKFIADIKVYITDDKRKASRVVYYVKEKFDAGDNLVYWTRSKWSANKIVYFVSDSRKANEIWYIAKSKWPTKI